jgi:hypothetical protein
MELPKADDQRVAAGHALAMLMRRSLGSLRSVEGFDEPLPNQNRRPYGAGLGPERPSMQCGFKFAFAGQPYRICVDQSLCGIPNIFFRKRF